MKFWADKELMDSGLMHSSSYAWTTFPAFQNYEKEFVKYYAMGPHLHDYLQEMNREVFSKYNVMSVANCGKFVSGHHNLVDTDRIN
jgi:oligo-1,6-glucosidase